MSDSPENSKIRPEIAGWQVFTDVLFSHVEELKDLRQKVGQFNAQTIFNRYDDEMMVAAYAPSNDTIG